MTSNECLTSRERLIPEPQDPLEVAGTAEDSGGSPRMEGVGEGAMPEVGEPDTASVTMAMNEPP